MENKKRKKTKEIQKEALREISPIEFDETMKKILSAPPEKKKEKPVSGKEEE